MNILAVDDEKDTLAFLRDLLVGAGHHVTTANNALEAMVHVQLRPFDLVLLDVMMPGMDGHQFGQFLSTHWQTFEIPIVILSCRTDAESKAWAKLNGVYRYLEKPLSPAELLEVVAEIERKRSKACP